MMLSVAAVAWLRTETPLLVWNASPSVPIGLYAIAGRSPMRGELAALWLPDPVRRLADARGYLAATAILVKPVAAGVGNIVCRLGPIISIDGHPAAIARTVDAAGRALPQWSGCRRLAAWQIFVLSSTPGSFDSRYFGPVDMRHVVGTAIALWTIVPMTGRPFVPCMVPHREHCVGTVSRSD